MKAEDKIRQAINYAKQHGVTISTDIWGIDYDYKTKQWLPKAEKTCCALAAVILKYVKGHLPDAMSFETASSNVLGVNEDWIDNFIRAFDGYQNADPNHEASKLALKIKEECTCVCAND